MKETPQRVKLMDTFMGFLALVGALQFLYAVLGGNYVSFLLSYPISMRKTNLGLGIGRKGRG